MEPVPIVCKGARSRLSPVAKPFRDCRGVGPGGREFGPGDRSEKHREWKSDPGNRQRARRSGGGIMRRKRELLAALFIVAVFLFSLPAGATSLWSDESRAVFVKSARHRVGDLLTLIIVEQSSAVSQNKARGRRNRFSCGARRGLLNNLLPYMRQGPEFVQWQRFGQHQFPVDRPVDRDWSPLSRRPETWWWKGDRRSDQQRGPGFIVGDGSGRDVRADNTILFLSGRCRD